MGKLFSIIKSILWYVKFFQISDISFFFFLQNGQALQGYGYGALEPHIDQETMMIHYERHHAAYTKNLNQALDEMEAAGFSNLTELPINQLLKATSDIPEKWRSQVRNNGGGFVNHNFFWKVISPEGEREPTGALAAQIEKDFGSFQNFKQEFEKAAATRFGSGWAWLHCHNGKLHVSSTPNQDVVQTLNSDYVPILGLDVWEHAYYLKYRNLRGTYISAWWNVVDWGFVTERFASCFKHDEL